LSTRLGDRSVVHGGEVGVGLFDAFGVRLALGVFGERPVDAGDGGFCPFRLPVGMISSGWIGSTDSPPARRRSQK
jgi:hypothetical protein